MVRIIGIIDGRSWIQLLMERQSDKVFVAVQEVAVVDGCGGSSGGLSSNCGDGGGGGIGCSDVGGEIMANNGSTMHGEKQCV